MELLLALSLLSAIVLMQVRIGLASRKRSPWRIALYACGVIAMVLLLQDGLLGVSINVAEEAANSGMASGGLASQISHVQAFMRIYLPLPVLLLCVFAAFEIVAFIWALCQRRMSGALQGSVKNMSRHGWANLVSFLVVPAIAFWIAGADSNRETRHRDYTNIAHNLTPVLGFYGAPAYWLGMRSPPIHPEADALPWSPHYSPTRAVTMFDFVQDSPPWIALSLLLAMVAALSRTGTAPGSVRRLLLGHAAAPQVEGFARIKALPWRGRYMLAGLALILWGMALALLLSGLLYGFIALFYSGAILLLPVVLAVVVYCFILGRRR